MADVCSRNERIEVGVWIESDGSGDFYLFTDYELGYGKFLHRQLVSGRGEGNCLEFYSAGNALAEDLVEAGFRNISVYGNRGGVFQISYRLEKFIERKFRGLVSKERIKNHWTRESDLIFV